MAQILVAESDGLVHVRDGLRQFAFRVVGFGARSAGAIAGRLLP